MDRFAEKQVQIEQRRDEMITRYPALWSNMVAEWNSPGPDERAWLLYSASYLFRTQDVRWAIDPLTLHWRIRDAATVDAAHDLRNLSFVLLTHRHADHLDIDLLSALRHLPITWVVPEFLLPIVIRKAGLPRRKIVVASHLEPVELNGIYILPFNGLHWETIPGKPKKGVPAFGYLVECHDKRWLFPGDTRTYDASQLPDFGPVDQLFAHLWLGRGCGLMGEPPLLDAFCQFCLDLKPHRIALTHLNEFGREADDLWDETHAQKVCSKFREMSANLSVVSLGMGSSVVL